MLKLILVLILIFIFIFINTTINININLREFALWILPSSWLSRVATGSERRVPTPKIRREILEEIPQKHKKTRFLRWISSRISEILEEILAQNWPPGFLRVFQKSSRKSLLKTTPPRDGDPVAAGGSPGGSPEDPQRMPREDSWAVPRLHKTWNKRRRNRGSPFYIYKLPIDRPSGCYVINIIIFAIWLQYLQVWGWIL